MSTIVLIILILLLLGACVPGAAALIGSVSRRWFSA